MTSKLNISIQLFTVIATFQCKQYLNFNFINKAEKKKENLRYKIECNMYNLKALTSCSDDYAQTVNFKRPLKSQNVHFIMNNRLICTDS